MGNVMMEASQINYRGGETKMSVEQALKETSGEAAAIAALQNDVWNLQSDKADLSVIAPAFSAETAYDAGDIVAYEGVTYRCTNAHEGEWDADDFAATTIANELSSLESGLTNVINLTATYQEGITGQIHARLVGKIALISGYFKANADVASNGIIASIGNLSLAVTLYTNVIGDNGALARIQLANDYGNGKISSNGITPAGEFYQFTFVGITS